MKYHTDVPDKDHTQYATRLASGQEYIA